MTMKQRCEICEMFDCGNKCKCKCHYGTTSKIRQDHDSAKGATGVKKGDKEEVAMEGLSALFG